MPGRRVVPGRALFDLPIDLVHSAGNGVLDQAGLCLGVSDAQELPFGHLPGQQVACRKSPTGELTALLIGQLPSSRGSWP